VESVCDCLRVREKDMTLRIGGRGAIALKCRGELSLVSTSAAPQPQTHHHQVHIKLAVSTGKRSHI